MASYVSHCLTTLPIKKFESYGFSTDFQFGDRYYGKLLIKNESENTIPSSSETFRLPNRQNAIRQMINHVGVAKTRTFTQFFESIEKPICSDPENVRSPKDRIFERLVDSVEELKIFIKSPFVDDDVVFSVKWYQSLEEIKRNWITKRVEELNNGYNVMEGFPNFYPSLILGIVIQMIHESKSKLNLKEFIFIDKTIWSFLDDYTLKIDIYLINRYPIIKWDHLNHLDQLDFKIAIPMNSNEMISSNVFVTGMFKSKFDVEKDLSLSVKDQLEFLKIVPYSTCDWEIPSNFSALKFFRKGYFDFDSDCFTAIPFKPISITNPSLFKDVIKFDLNDEYLGNHDEVFPYIVPVEDNLWNLQIGTPQIKSLAAQKVPYQFFFDYTNNNIKGAFFVSRFIKLSDGYAKIYDIGVTVDVFAQTFYKPPIGQKWEISNESFQRLIQILQKWLQKKVSCNFDHLDNQDESFVFCAKEMHQKSNGQSYLLIMSL